jgi:ribosomal subunit interface protein
MKMQVEIVAPEMGGFDANQEVVWRVLDKFDKYLNDFPEEGIFARVALNEHPSNERWVQSAIELMIPGAPKVYAGGEGENKLQALNDAADEVERQLRRIKEKREFS